jgi:hypothetical protein
MCEFYVAKSEPWFARIQRLGKFSGVAHLIFGKSNTLMGRRVFREPRPTNANSCASRYPPIYVGNDRLHAKGWAAHVAYPPV